MRAPDFRLIMLCLVAFSVLPEITTADDKTIDPAIAKHRMGQIVIQAQPNTQVSVEQQRHESWFGAAISNRPFERDTESPDAIRYKKTFVENFNAAVTENALKWHTMESRQGRVNYRVVDAILDWTDANKIPLRGHNIFWGVTHFVPKWQQSLTNNGGQTGMEPPQRTVNASFRRSTVRTSSKPAGKHTHLS